MANDMGWREGRDGTDDREHRRGTWMMRTVIVIAVLALLFVVASQAYATDVPPTPYRPVVSAIR
jgi:Tfp pilus assembly protein PilE